MSLPQRGHHHGGPLLGFTVTAEVEADAVVWWSSETHLMATRRFDLILHRAQVELCNELWAKKDQQHLNVNKSVPIHSIFKNRFFLKSGLRGPKKKKKKKRNHITHKISTKTKIATSSWKQLHDDTTRDL